MDREDPVCRGILQYPDGENEWRRAYENGARSRPVLNIGWSFGVIRIEDHWWASRRTGKGKKAFG